MSLLKMPYSNLHELNLDWIIEQLNSPDGPVRSVNGKNGIVVLTGEDIARSTSNPQTVADAFQSQGSALQSVQNKLGTTALPTTAQTVTGAIAEHETDINDIKTEIGTTVLPTIAQTLTGAIAENATDIANVDDAIGTTALPTTAQTITGAIAEHENDITSINGSITTLNTRTTRQNIGVTLNNTGNSYFTHAATHGSLINGIYCVSFNITTLVELPATEFNIGTVSVNPQWTVTGYMVVNNSSALAGAAQITSSGAIYIRANEAIPANRDIIVTVMGVYY